MDKYLADVKYTLLRSSGVILFLLLWEFSTQFGWVDREFIPPLTVVLKTVLQLFLDGQLLPHLIVSMWRALMGLSTALIIALPLGYFLATSLAPFSQTIYPVLRIFSQVNPFSLMPVFILFFGMGEIAKIAVITWVCLWPVVFNTITGIKTIDPYLLKSARSLGIKSKDLILKVLIPGAAPSIFVGIRTAAGLTFFILIAAEMIGASAGLGWMVHNSAMVYQIPRLYASGIFIIILGFCLNRFLLQIEEQAFPWRQSPTLSRSKVTKNKAAKQFTPSKIALTSVIIVGFLILGSYETDYINKSSVIKTTEEGHHHGEDAEGSHSEGSHTESSHTEGHDSKMDHEQHNTESHGQEKR